MKKKIFTRLMAAALCTGIFATSGTVALADSTYVVKKGDNLWKIAKETLGDGANYKAIFDANKDKIKNPNKIYIGQELVIPSGVASVPTPAPAPAEPVVTAPAETTVPEVTVQPEVTEPNVYVGAWHCIGEFIDGKLQLVDNILSPDFEDKTPDYQSLRRLVINEDGTFVGNVEGFEFVHTYKIDEEGKLVQTDEDAYVQIQAFYDEADENLFFVVERKDGTKLTCVYKKSGDISVDVAKSILGDWTITARSANLKIDENIDPAIDEITITLKEGGILEEAGIKIGTYTVDGLDVVLNITDSKHGEKITLPYIYLPTQDVLISHFANNLGEEKIKNIMERVVSNPTDITPEKIAGEWKPFYFTGQSLIGLDVIEDVKEYMLLNKTTDKVQDKTVFKADGTGTRTRVSGTEVGFTYEIKDNVVTITLEDGKKVVFTYDPKTNSLRSGVDKDSELPTLSILKK